MTDTRAGFWLQLAVVLLTVAVVAVDCLFGHAHDQTLREMLAIAVAPASVLLPIVGSCSSRRSGRSAQGW
jgi:ABC-2 type transport system permease protein